MKVSRIETYEEKQAEGFTFNEPPFDIPPGRHRGQVLQYDNWPFKPANA